MEREAGIGGNHIWSNELMIDGHEAKVRGFFEETNRYLHKRFGIRIRQELVAELTGDLDPAHVLDVGCGDGSLSLQFAERAETLTLVDLSAAMLRLAEGSVDPALKRKFSFINGGYATVPGTDRKYDLVLAIGLLAHLNSPGDFIRDVAGRISAGGCLLVQFTSANHPLTRLSRFLRSNTYNLSRLNRRDVDLLLQLNGFTAIKMRRFSLQFPGMGRLPDNFLCAYEKMLMRSRLLSHLCTDYIVLARKL